ncbi:MAG: cellulose binding domain-containing protein, partial [Cyanobacteria bacterium P01_A01_bin.135]
MTAVDLTFSVENDWGSGFTGKLLLEPQVTLDGWTVSFDANFEIANLWNATVVSRSSEGRYVISSKDWNSDVDPGDTISIGFNGRSSDDSPQIGQAQVDSPSLDAGEPAEPDSEPDTPEPDDTGDGDGSDGDTGSNTGSDSGDGTSGDASEPDVPQDGGGQGNPDPGTGSDPGNPSAGDDPTGASGAAIGFEAVNSWPGGFTANMTVQSDGDVDGWSVVVETAFEITNIWNATIADRVSVPGGYRYTIENAAWNGAIAAGESANFGINGAGQMEAPEAIAFNGEPTAPSTPPSDGSDPTPPSDSDGDGSSGDGQSGDG